MILMLTVAHIHTKLRKFLICSFSVFMLA